MNEKGKAIAVVGLPGSGKGTLSEVAREAGFFVVAFGDITREVTKREAKEGTETNAFTVTEVANRLRKEVGPDWIAREAEKKAKGHTLICFDDPRTPEEIGYLKSQNPSLQVFAVVSDNETRYSRILSRKRWDDLGTIDDVRKKDKESGGAWGIAKLTEEADVVLENNSSLEDFRRKAETAIGRLLSSGGGNSQ